MGNVTLKSYIQCYSCFPVPSTVSVNKCRDLMITPTNRKQTSSNTFVVRFFPYPQSLAVTHLFSVTIGLPFSECHINGIFQYAVFCWLRFWAMTSYCKSTSRPGHQRQARLRFNWRQDYFTWSLCFLFILCYMRSTGLCSHKCFLRWAFLLKGIHQ